MASLLFCLPDTTKREADKLVKSWPGLIQCITVQPPSLRSSKFLSEIPLQVAASLSSKTLKEVKDSKVLSTKPESLESEYYVYENSRQVPGK